MNFRPLLPVVPRASQTVHPRAIELNLFVQPNQRKHVGSWITNGARQSKHSLQCARRFARQSLALLLLVPAMAMADQAGSDCQCRAPGGEMRDLGSVECVDIVGNQTLMVCVMSTNTPYWKRINKSNGCPA